MKLKIEPFITGVGMTLAASVILPMLKTGAKPIVSGGITGVTIAGTEARKKLSYVLEEVEDFMADVQYQRHQRRSGEFPTSRH